MSRTTEMEAVCKELDELKQAMEVLQEDHRTKSELSESLRRAHSEQLTKLQEAKATIEKQAQEIGTRAEEISRAREIYEDLKSSFAEKESVLRNLSLTNENLRTTSKEELMKLEKENRELVSSLDEANSKMQEHVQKISAYEKEMKGLKLIVSQSQKKCFEAEERSYGFTELRRRDQLLESIEQEKGKLEDKLKWKSEQFRHLEEAHCKLQDGFRAGKREWEREKCNLLDEMSSLQMNLDLQTRAVEDLRSRLQRCNEALAHEESRRKLLEIQTSESKALYENVILEYEEAKSCIDTLTGKQDLEIAGLRNTLVTKEASFKEIEFRNYHLEQENEELKRSLKEFHGAQINGVEATASLKTLRQKYKALEQAHKSYSKKLRAKEVECNNHNKELGKDLEECFSELHRKNKQLSELHVQLEGSYSLLMQQKLENEETSVVLMVFKSKFVEAMSKLESMKLENHRSSMQVEGKIACLIEQLEKKDSALIQAQAEIKRELEMVKILQERIACMESSTNKKYVSILREIDIYKGKLEESSRIFHCFKEQASQRESALQKNLREVSDALKDTNSALAERAVELNMFKAMLEESSRSFNCFKEQAFQKEKDLQGDLRKALDALGDANSALSEKTRELDEYEEMLEESSRSILRFKEQASKRENDLKEDLKKAVDALDHVNSALSEKTIEAAKSESRVHEMKFVIERLERLKSGYENELVRIHQEKIAISKDLDACLSEKMMVEAAFMQEKLVWQRNSEEKDKKIEELQQQVLMLQENHVRRQYEFAPSVKPQTRITCHDEKGSKKLSIAEDVYERLEDISSKFVKLEQEHAGREAEYCMAFEQEKEKFLEAMIEKEFVIVILHQQLLELRRNLAGAAESTAASKLSGKSYDNERLNEVLDKILSAHILDQQHIQFNSLLIAGVEEESASFQRKFEFVEKLSFDLKKSILKMEVELVAERLEKDNDRAQFEKEMKSMLSDSNILKDRMLSLEGNIENLHLIISQLTLEREELQCQMVGLSNLVGEVSNKEEELVDILEKIMKKARDEEAMTAYTKEGIFC